MLLVAEVLQVSAELCGLITQSLCPRSYIDERLSLTGFGGATWSPCRGERVELFPLLAIISHFKAAF